MKIQEKFQGMFKLISIVGQVLYLRRQTIEHPNPRIISSPLVYLPFAISTCSAVVMILRNV